MSNALINFYNNLEEPIIIYDKKQNILYHNLSFKKIFGEFNNSKGFDCLNKLSYKFSYQMCFLKSEDLRTYNPIISAINKEVNFTTYATYQMIEDKFYHFMIKSFNLKKRYRIIYFYDITNNLQGERLREENERLRIQNIEFASTNSKVQNQAVKMALLNRISISIKNELDIKTLIEKSLKELSIVFGASKSYFAELKKNDFAIKYTYPEVYAPQIGEEVVYSKSIIDDLHNGINSIQACIKEHEGASIPLLNSTTRIIMPIIKNEQLYGIVVIFTPRKEISEIERELLVGISMVISSSLSQANLFHQISQKKEELENAIKELKETQLQLINSEKMASLGQLVASVAHEINTPLGAINANNEMMDKVFNKYDENALEMLREINSVDREAIKRITNIVQSLKRFVRLDETTQQEANINQELDLTIDLIHHKIKNGFEIEKDYGDIPLVSCYPNMLNQVFLNILMNAVHSIEDIKSKNSSYVGKIKLKTQIDEDYLKISIFDNGKGIDSDNQEKIFHAGFTTKKKGQGTGLGLAICKKIIEKHEGKIEFKSGKDFADDTFKTVFVVSIPIF
ncbi:MAG: GAF domain-containing sensor histidine kinase [Candidatus Gastranaerophilales bacterium]|nr:GAF domain-containing sensor histidine kinase [Candidatus Gastranaerophilales bacterium]